MYGLVILNKTGMNLTVKDNACVIVRPTMTNSGPAEEFTSDHPFRVGISLPEFPDAVVCVAPGEPNEMFLICAEQHFLETVESFQVQNGSKDLAVLETARKRVR